MIELIVFSVLLNTEDGNIYATIPEDPIKVEARKRGKNNRRKRRGSDGLR